MTQATLLSASVAASAAGGVYAFLAWRLHQDAHLRGAKNGAPLRSFAVWWGALGVNLLLVAATYVLAAFDTLPVAGQLVVSVAQRVLLGVGVAGLLHYLIFLRTGRNVLLPLAVVYAAYTGLSLVSLALARPEGVMVGEWRTELTYALGTPPWVRALGLLVVLPSIIAAFAYFALCFQTHDPSRRYRIVVVSWAIILWWVLAVVAGQTALLDVGWLQVLNRATSVVTAILVLTAYHPPRWLSRRWAERSPLAELR